MILKTLAALRCLGWYSNNGYYMTENHQMMSKIHSNPEVRWKAVPLAK